VHNRAYATTAALGRKYLTTPITTTTRHCGDNTSKKKVSLSSQNVKLCYRLSSTGSSL